MNQKLDTDRVVGLTKHTKTGTIGLLAAFTPEIFKSEYHAQIISGVIGGVLSTPYEFRLVMVRDEEWAGDSEQVLSRHRVDGLLLLTWRLHLRHMERKLQGDNGLPLVTINDFAPDVKTNIVYTDAAMGARLAMNHLLNRGYRRIGMLQAPDEDSLDAREREQVVRKVLEEEGIELDPLHFKKCDYFFEEDGYIKTLEMIHGAKRLPRALLCFNDDLAVGAIRALREEKILIPQEVAVIGFDGIERGKYVNPPLTTIRQPLEQMGQKMVSVLMGVIRGVLTPPVQVKFEPQLVIRQSA